ncbi:hypothetical protein MK079_02935 [Candidatus Gracilibacteria bacterium]|nr:hypothetical protein [Candidatus Gracilibacteria bacterium]
MKVKVIAGLCVVLSFASVSVFADGHEETSDKATKVQQIKVQKAEMRAEMIERKATLKADIAENRAEAKTNRENWRAENKSDIKQALSELGEDDKQELKNIRDTFKSDTQSAREAYEASEKSSDDRETLLEALKTAHENMIDASSEIAGDNEALKELYESRKEVFEANRELRVENRENRQEFRLERQQYVEKYRQAFVQRLGNAIEKIPTEKLEKVDGKIDAMMEKISNNEKLSDDKKDAYLDQLQALKDIIVERLEDIDLDESIEADLEDLFDVE